MRRYREGVCSWVVLDDRNLLTEAGGAELDRQLRVGRVGCSLLSTCKLVGVGERETERYM